MRNLERIVARPKPPTGPHPTVVRVVKLREVPRHEAADVAQVYIGELLARYANEMEMSPARLVEIVFSYGVTHFQEAMSLHVERVQAQGGLVA